MFKKISSFLKFFLMALAFFILTSPFLIFSTINKGVKKIKNILGFHDKNSIDSDVFFENHASADNPWWGVGGGEVSTPFLYVWNGEKYIYENDIMMSPGKNYHPDYSVSRDFYESGGCGGDLYKIKNRLVPDNDGKLRLQIREIDPEESFIDRLKLLKVIHREDEELIVANNYRDFYLIRKDKMAAAVLPDRVEVDGKTADGVFGPDFQSGSKGVRLERGRNVSVSFSGINPRGENFIAVRAEERGWSPQAKTVFAVFPALRYAAMAVVGIFASRFSNKLPSFLPFIMLADGNRSIRFSYKSSGGYKFFDEIHPRMKQSVELVPIPKGAVSSDGRMALDLKWTRTHQLDSMAIIDSANLKTAEKVEEMAMISAEHDRSGKDFSGLLKNRNFDYLHTIQGDTVDLVFKGGERPGKNETADFLVSADGFYTDLSLKNRGFFRKLAWLIGSEN